MKRVICKHGEVSSGFATVTLERDGLTMVVKHVPAKVCDSCGEEYRDEEIASKLSRPAVEMIRSGAQVDVREYQPS